MGCTRIGAVIITAVVVLAGMTAAPGFVGASAGPRRDYIVVLHDGADSGAVAADHARRHGAHVRHVYRHALSGYAATMTEAAAGRVVHDPRVRSIELDQQATIADQVAPTGVRRIFAPGNANLDIDGTDDLRVDVDVAIIDTGVDLDHPDLHVNTSGSVNCLTSSGNIFNRTYSCTSGGDDDNGHGSHVAGTVAALDNSIGVVGVAPGARLWAVKVLDRRGSGPIGAIVAGIDWVTGHAHEIEVANMSLGCECTSPAMNDAIRNSVAAGVTYVVAAGNNDKDASTFSPANHPDVITVSALADFNGLPGGGAAPTCRTDEDDTLANFSNFGSLIEIAAPGVCIRSTVPGGGYDTYSGTSMASPHVAGAAALLASTGNPSPATIRTNLVGSGNVGWTDDSGDGITEPLLDVSSTTLFAPTLITVTGGGGGGGDPEPSPITLTARPYKVKGIKHVDLTWGGGTAPMTITRDSTVAVGTGLAGSGSMTDNIGAKGGGSHTYQACNNDGSGCSDPVTVSF
jgi:subtilisin family serine protease